MPVRNALGPFDFVEWTNTKAASGAPELVAEMSELIQRPGVDGTGVRRVGKKAEPFQMMSGVDVTQGARGGALIFAQYCSWKGQRPLEMVWRGIDYDGLKHRYVVLDVQQLGLFALRSATGGLNGTNANGYLQALWTLLPVVID